MSAPLHVAPAAYAELVRTAVLALPHECVGALLGRQTHVVETVPVQGRLPSPCRFDAAPAGLMEAEQRARGMGREIVAYFHSHPTCEARPSQADLASQLWPDLPPHYHVIVSQQDAGRPVIQPFYIRDGRWEAVPLVLGGM